LGKTEIISPKRRNKTRVSKLLCNLVLEFLSRAIRQEEKIKGILIGKEIVKLSLPAADMILYLKVPKTPPKTCNTINSFSKEAGSKINL
jgi:hypothetical protein